MSQLLTIEAISEILAVHTRTVRRYIKEGKLPAQKVGGQWRITSENLKAFLGIESFEEIANKNTIPVKEKEYTMPQDRPRILISSVVDIHVTTRDEAMRITNTIIAAMNNRNRDDPARCDSLFYEEEGKLRFMLWGNPAFMSTMISMFELLTD